MSRKQEIDLNALSAMENDARREMQDSRLSNNKKDTILWAAMKMFLENGYSNTSLRQIAQESGTSASLIIYHYGTKQAIAEEYMNGKMRELRHALMQKVDIRSEPELFCCTFVRLYQSVMASPNFCRFYHDIIEEGVFRSFFFEDDVYGINVSDLILAKRQVQLSSNMYSFYSHYIIPGVELASWISEGEKAPEGDKLDVPFRALMGIIYVPKEEVDGYCAQAKMLVDKILAEHPQFLEL